jgi:hypothetical protein
MLLLIGSQQSEHRQSVKRTVSKYRETRPLNSKHLGEEYFYLIGKKGDVLFKRETGARITHTLYMQQGSSNVRSRY